MDHRLLGLAVNPALPSHLVDRPTGVADEGHAPALAGRADLSRPQVRVLAARSESAAVHLAHDGRLGPSDVEQSLPPRRRGQGAPALTARRPAARRAGRISPPPPPAPGPVPWP